MSLFVIGRLIRTREWLPDRRSAFSSLIHHQFLGEGHQLDKPPISERIEKAHHLRLRLIRFERGRVIGITHDLLASRKPATIADQLPELVASLRTPG